VNTSAYTEREKGSALGDWLSENAQVLSIALFFTACVFFFSMTTNTFLTVPNILNVIRQAAPILIVATAMTLVIITAGIDLSVGSLVALINAVAAIAIAAGVPWPLVVIGMLLLGGSIGLAQGWFTAYQGIPAFIVTLAGLSILRGIALYLTEGYSIPIRDVPGFLFIGRGEILGIPVPAIIAISIILAGHVVLNHTRYGRRVIAVGSNPEAARRVGMPARGVVASVYADAAVGFELQVIAAVVLGGTSLMGGRGSLIGTLLGTMTIAVIGNGLILLRISPFFTQIVTGAIILIAIWLNTRLFTRGTA